MTKNTFRREDWDQNLIIEERRVPPSIQYHQALYERGISLYVDWMTSKKTMKQALIDHGFSPKVRRILHMAGWRARKNEKSPLQKFIDKPRRNDLAKPIPPHRTAIVKLEDETVLTVNLADMKQLRILRYEINVGRSVQIFPGK